MSQEAEEADLKTHVAVCAERYNGIDGRLKKIESILIGGAGTIIAALAAVAWTVATK